MSKTVTHFNAQYIKHLKSPLGWVNENGPTFNANGIGVIKSSGVDTLLKLWIEISESAQIINIAWNVKGLPQFVAGMSAFIELLNQKSVDDGIPLEYALSVTQDDIANLLGGLPAKKIHETILANKALHLAVANYFENNGYIVSKIKNNDSDYSSYSLSEKGEQICECYDVTLDEIAKSANLGESFEDLQQNTGIGTGCRSCEADGRALHIWVQMNKNIVG